jgi:hypothetical protein
MTSSLKQQVLLMLIRVSGLSIEECTKIMEVNKNSDSRTLLRFILNNYELSDESIKKIEELIYHSEEE